jgi:hypothetical protein
MITRHIADLLYHHECVIVPGLGGFIKASNPAWILHSTHEFYPPSGSVAFNAGLSANDGLLANHIAAAENTSYREALYDIKVWVDTSVKLLKRDEKVALEGIGELFLNTSGNIEFTPARQINFNADSFGLPVFRAKPATAIAEQVIPEIQPSVRSGSHSKFRHLVPETLKWAAVLAPFVAFVLWGSIKGNLIDNYIHNYTGMYSWVRSTPGKTAPVTIAVQVARVEETPAEVVKSPAGVLADENITFNPGIISYCELAKEDIYYVAGKLPGDPDANSPAINKDVVPVSESISKTVPVIKADALSNPIPAPGVNSNENASSISGTTKNAISPKADAGIKTTTITAYPWPKFSKGPAIDASSKTNVVAKNTTGVETKATIKIAPAEEPITKSTPVGKSNFNTQAFHIIGGAFRDHNNALKLIRTLESKGYSPAIVDTTPGGLYVVSMIGFNTLKEAELKLKDLKKEGFPASWIMKNKKS